MTATGASPGSPPDMQGLYRPLNLYCQALDAGDVDAWLDCFCADGILDFQRVGTDPEAYARILEGAVVHDGFVRFEGAAALRTFANWHGRALSFAFLHVTTNTLARPSPLPDEARLVSGFMRLDDKESGPAIGCFGNYEDELRWCGDGMWRFARRIARIRAPASRPPPDAG